MEIVERSASIHVDKGDGTVVDYYLFPEYEIHYNEVAPGTVQQWHHHNAIEETLYVIDGTLEARWREVGQERSRAVGPGDVVRVEDSVHTFANTSGAPVRFVVFRLVLDGTDKRELIKRDKVVDES